MQLSRGVQVSTAKQARWVEELSRGHEISRSIHHRYRDCDKNQLKSSIDKLGVEEVSRLLKNSSQEGKNIDMNAIKRATQPRIQTTF